MEKAQPGLQNGPKFRLLKKMGYYSNLLLYCLGNSKLCVILSDVSLTFQVH